MLKRIRLLAGALSVFLSVVMVTGGAATIAADETGWALVVFGVAVAYSGCRGLVADLRASGAVGRAVAVANSEMEF